MPKRIYLIEGIRYHAHTNGGGRVADTATVADSVFVAETATIKDRAKVYGSVRLEDRSVIADEAEVFGTVILRDQSRIAGKAKVCGATELYGDTVIEGHAQISGIRKLRNVQITGNTILNGNQDLKEGAVVWRNSEAFFS